MKIICLELKGYKRLSLNSIEYIKYTPENKIQQILGTNGSGKSSLMKELSPLPAIPSEFHKEGFKIIEILHNNSVYNLKSIFSSTGNKFYFIKNGEELNPGNTTTVYKELVKKHFNITQDIHELMTGSNSFHQMSTSERRNWFTRISEADYTYAFSVYQNLREQQRDIQGAIKLNQSRLVQENEKLLNPKEEELIREEIKIYNELLHLFLSYKETSKYTEKEILEVIDSLEKNLISNSNLLSKTRSGIKISGNVLKKEPFTSVNDIDDYLIEIKSYLSSFHKEAESLYKKIDQDTATINLIKKSNIDSLQNLIDQQYVIEREIETIETNMRFRLNKGKDFQLMLNAFNSIENNLVEIFTALEPNPYEGEGNDRVRKYSKVNRDKCNYKLEFLESSLKQTIINRDNTVIRIKELDHLKTHDEITCPKCDHKWYARYSEEEHIKQKDSLQFYAVSIETTQTQINELRKYIDSFSEYSSLLNSYISIKRNWPILTNLFETVENSLDIFENPKKYSRSLHEIRSCLEEHVKVDFLLNKVSELKELNIKLNTNQAISIEDLEKNIEISNSNLDFNRNNINIFKKEESDLILCRQSVIKILELKQALDNLSCQREQALYDYVNIARQNAINEYIQIARLEISKREQLISRVDIQNSIVKNLESQIQELNDKNEVIKIAVRELSPTEGLIAKGLTGFINHFVSQMNSFIKKIWLYPLELVPIVPTEEDGVDLDYKFGVTINDSNFIPDINKASSAMKEVIDLAFRLVSMRYLKLEEAPVYLDELGSSFDKQHREAVVNLIKNLAISNDYSNIFIISHYQEMYGSFINSDITALCQNNIPNLTTPFNKVCIIK